MKIKHINKTEREVEFILENSFGNEISIFVNRKTKEVSVFEEDFQHRFNLQILGRNMTIYYKTENDFNERQTTEEDYEKEIKRYFSSLDSEIFKKIKSVLEEENIYLNF